MQKGREEEKGCRRLKTLSKRKEISRLKQSIRGRGCCLKEKGVGGEGRWGWGCQLVGVLREKKNHAGGVGTKINREGRRRQEGGGTA